MHELERLRHALNSAPAVSFKTSDELVVIHTAPAWAGLIGAAINASMLEHVIGCIAGDDTILVVVSDRARATLIADLLAGLVEH